MKTLSLGVKTDPINTRYSFPWLFDLLAEEGVRYVQVGSFFELYFLEEEWFHDLRQSASERGLTVRSLFTAHRELGGFFYADPRMEKTARSMCERFLHVGSWLGVDFVGWNPGAVHRDRMETKETGLEIFHRHLEELMHMAHGLGLKGLCLEPMSCLAEPPSTPEEITSMMETASAFHRSHPDRTVPVYLCGDISHGVADHQRAVVHNNWDLYSHAVPWMAEFHFKNTDAIFNSTFGFSPEETARGIVDLKQLKALIHKNASRFPLDEVTGYLEIGGPKVGRDYSDPLLRGALKSSLQALREVFGADSA